jgi:soluble lytic murein transglycosylase-like protein
MDADLPRLPYTTRNPISRFFSEITGAPADLVRLLPLGSRGMKLKSQHRIICPCQIHAARERTLWRRAAKKIRRGGLAFLVAAPLAYGAIGFPLNAMDIRLPGIARLARAERSLPIFNTPRIRSTFGTPAAAPRQFTLDIAKEQFFSTHVPYGSIIYREARRNNLPPELVAAVVEAESDFRPRLISNKNAQGLMQIIPETGRLMGADDLFDPQENIAAGTKYLRYLYDRFEDDRLVLAAYNAGEGNIEKFGGIPPFGETKAYIDRVTTRTSQYRQSIRGHFATAARMQVAQ